MSPSQIVKSAYARAQQAGFTGTLKAFARQVCDLDNDDITKVAPPSPTLLRATKSWLATKAKQRKQARTCARKARRGYGVVHAQQHARSMEHCTGRGTPVFVREGGRS